MGILEDVRNIFLNLKIENLGRASDLQNAKFLLPDFFIYVSECYTVASVSDRH